MIAIRKSDNVQVSYSIDYNLQRQKRYLVSEMPYPMTRKEFNKFYEIKS